MIIDCREWPRLPDGGVSQRNRVFVNGEEVRHVWYLDTDKGIVKTYDVDGTGMIRVGVDNEYLTDESVEIVNLQDRIASRTIHGAIELKPIEE